jgi:hypothetical protein
MKVVINVCHGGFGLSPRALKRFAAQSGRECYFFTYGRTLLDGRLDLNKYVEITIEEAEKTLFMQAFDTKTPPSSPADWNKLSLAERKAFNDEYSKHIISFEQQIGCRSDPNLVKVVEELGTDADGPLSKLRVVDVPREPNEVEISEYDGWESIEEKHRSWS